MLLLQGGANCVKFSRNGEFFASGSADEQVKYVVLFIFIYNFDLQVGLLFLSNGYFLLSNHNFTVVSRVSLKFKI